MVEGVPLGANVYRGIYLKRRYGLSYASYLGIVSFYSWYFTLTTLAFCWMVWVLSAGPNGKISALF